MGTTSEQHSDPVSVKHTHSSQIPSIEGRYERWCSSSASFSVKFQSSERFVSGDSSARNGYILPKHRQLIEGLLNEATLTLFATCTPEPTSNNRPSVPTCSQTSCALDITVYGPFELFEELGEWFQEYNVYLQDPKSCDLNVKYCNPHRLSSSNFALSPLLSQVVAQASSTLQFLELRERPDILEAISGQEDLAETTPSSLIRTHLHRYSMGLQVRWDLALNS